MAEIEFKRRGTPLWVVGLALLIVAAIVWALVARRHAAAPGTAAVPAPSPPVTPTAVVAGPTAQFAAWTDSSRMPAAADAQPAHIGDGLQLLSGALAERVPLAGVQVNLIRAMADTLHMPSLKQSQYLNATQAAFFAAAFALRQTSAGTPLNDKAAALILTKPLSQQTAQVDGFFSAPQLRPGGLVWSRQCN